MHSEIRKAVINRFRRDYPWTTRELSNQEILLIFKLYKKNYNKKFYRSDVSLLVAGTLLILIASLFMNAGAQLEIISSSGAHKANKIVMNTIVSSATSGLYNVLTWQYSNIMDSQRIQATQQLYHFDVNNLCSSVLAGLVSVTAGCSRIEIIGAVMIGMTGGVIFSCAKKVLSRYEIDDPLDVSEIHGFCGLWSILAVGFFDTELGLFYGGQTQ